MVNGPEPLTTPPANMANVAGQLNLPDGQPAVNSKVRFDLMYCGCNVGRVTGSNTIVPETFILDVPANGAWSTTVYGNDKIVCGADTGGNSRWRITYIVNGAELPATDYQINSGANPFNPDSASLCSNSNPGVSDINCAVSYPYVVPPPPPVAGPQGPPGPTGPDGPTGPVGPPGPGFAGGGVLSLWPGNWLGINIAGSSNGGELGKGASLGMAGTQIGGSYPVVLVAPTATQPRGAKIQSATLNNTSGIMDSAQNLTLGILKDWFMKGAIDGLTVSRYFIGMTDMSPSSVGVGFFTDTPNANFVGFRWSETLDTTHFKAICQTDSTHQTIVDTGVTVVKDAYHLFEIVPTSGGATIKFYIDGVLVATISSNVPASTVAMATLFTVDAKNSGSSDFNFIFNYVYACVSS
jgi:hypothetical protein